MKRTYTTSIAAKKIGVSFRTLNRWIALGKIKASQGIPLADGRQLWVWTEADIERGRRVKSEQHPGPKAKTGKR